MTVLVTMQTVSAALYLQKLWQGPCEIVPVPRELSSSCGYAAEVELAGEAQTPRLVEVMNQHALEWEGVYAVEQPEGQPLYRTLASYS